MKIFVTGTRGIPDVPGGVESHCQHLYPLVVQHGHSVKLCRRSGYVDDGLASWRGVELVDIFSPGKKSLEAIVHTFLAILEARRWGADVLHVHAVGPSLMIPFARLLGMKVVMTNHGPDYDRQKWGGAARTILKLGEYLGGRCANEVIVISQHIREIVRRRCARDSVLIPNGVEIPKPATARDFIDDQGLEPGQYLLAVARFVPEKGLHDLVSAFDRIETPWKLLIAGDADHEDDYSRTLKEAAAANPDIVLTGYLTGEALHQAYSHAGLFVMPSYHEGLPIALLEAMSYGLPVLVSDIPANLEVNLGTQAYFSCGNVAELAEQILNKTSVRYTEAQRTAQVETVRKNYDWVTIAADTVRVYEGLVAE
jgi:glycosyltransferase involved in cell wall biosynthesis